MASKPSRRSISFEILPNNSPGDGDSVVFVNKDTILNEKVANKPRRRRRKSKSRKLSVDDLSPISPVGEDSSFAPLSTLLGSRVLPLEGSLHELGVNSSLFSSDRWNGDSTAESSPSLSTYSPTGPLSATLQAATARVSGLGAYVQGEIGSSENTNGTSISQNIDRFPLDSLNGHENFSSSTDFHKPDNNSDGWSSRNNQAADEVYSNTRTPDHSVKFRKHEIYASMYSSSPGNLQLDPQGLSDRVLESKHQLRPTVPNHCAASEGLTEAVIAPLSPHPASELRQRLVERTVDKQGQKNAAGGMNSERKLSHADLSPSASADQRTTPPAKKNLGTFTTPQLKDWERLMASNVQYPPPLELSPVKYLLTEVCGGSALRSTTSVGTEQKRERVYNTMFHVPWRCELLIDVGFVVCLDAFLSLFTVMPARIVMFIWQRLVGLVKCRRLQRPYAAELCDLACLLVLVVGVAILMQADISIIYHWIRGQGVVKLYVVFNVLEIFDKLCQSFGADVLQVLFNSALSVECCKIDQLAMEMARFAFDQCIAIFCFLVHSLVIISQAITLSAAVNAQNNALLALLISNNFAEIKSNVFKRMGTDQLHKMAYHDTVERFHIMTHVLFVWAQNILNADDSAWAKFIYNAGMVYMCEVMVDVIKHSFLAKFNEVKPAAYSQFLQSLCSQTLNSQSHEVHKTLTFVPLAPACVVIRILLPVYAACIPEGPILLRWPSMLLLGGLTYVSLVIVKVVVGLSLQIHAKWYLKRHPWTKPHPHFE